ncbi:MAG: hypothetical protein FWD23_17580, partial [Oscillospiraceae bacterium]|nr:hypothetical protein [Oscillospiraceae bacterium]
DLSKSWWDQNALQEFTIGKETHVATGDISLYGLFSSWMFYMNKTLVKTYNLEDPYQLVRDGKWTWDKMHEMAKAVSADTDGDGAFTLNDQVGMFTDQTAILYGLFAAGERMSGRDENNYPVMVMQGERHISVLDKILEVTTDRSVGFSSIEAKDYANPWYEYAVPKIQNDSLLFLSNWLLLALELRGMESDFGIMPPPKFDENQQGYFGASSAAWRTCLFIPTTNNELERTGNIIQAMGYYAKKEVTPVCMDATVTHKLVRDDDSLEMLQIINSSRIYDIAELYNWGEIYAMYWNMYNAKKQTYASSYERIEAKINAALDKTLAELNG